MPLPASQGWTPGGAAGALSPGSLPGVKLWLLASLGIVFGGWVTPVQNAGVAALVTVTGTGPAFAPATKQSIEITIDGAGAVGVATFKWFLNGVLQAAGVLTAAAVVLNGTATANFPVHVYAVNDDWTTVPSVFSWTSQDASATVFTQAVQAKQPAYISAGLVLTGWAASINGQAGVRGDGVSRFLPTAAAAFAGIAQPYAVYLVVQRLGAGGGTDAMFADSASTLFYFNGAGGTNVVFSCDGVNFLQRVDHTAITLPQLWSLAGNGASSQLGIFHGGVNNAGAVGIGTTISVLGFTTGTLPFNGDICEVVIGPYPTVANDNAIKAYFVPKYGLP